MNPTPITLDNIVQHLIYGDIEEMPLSILGDDCPSAEQFAGLDQEQQTRLASAATVLACLQGRLHPSGYLITPEGAAKTEPAFSPEKVLAEVMQDIWNDRAIDCGEVPTCFEIKGPRTTRVYADFEESQFVWNIVETLRARGYSIVPNHLPASRV